MSKDPEVSLFQVQFQPYLYLSIETNQKNGNNYLFLIDKEYGGINSASIPGIDLNCEFNSDSTLLHSDEFLVGAYFKTYKENKQDLIICTANTQKSSPSSQKPITINIFDHLIYKINEISFYNVSKNTVSKISRPDLYFSPDFDLTSNFPYTDNTIGYNKVLDNNNKFCWNKELIRPFSKFYGNPCIIILQGNVDRLSEGEPDIIFISKFMQINPFDLNLEHNEDKNILDDEIKCQCELIFPPIGNYSTSSHLWMIVKTKHKDKKYFNESGKDVVLFDISDKFKNESILLQYKEFDIKHSDLFDFSFDLLFSDYNANTAIENQNQQTKIFYLIGDNIIELINSSFLYICKYVSNFQLFSKDDSQLFSSGTNSQVEIPIKKDLFNFFRKSIYHTGNIYNNGNIIQWSLEPKDMETPFHKESNDLYKFNRISKSEKFILDSRHVSISYFNPADRSNLIKVKAHFQDEFIISQISINLRHRDPSQIITMEISFDEDTLNHHFYCPQVPLPNPDKEEETYTFNLHKIAKDSLLYPIDYKCFEKTRFLTLNFINKPDIEINTFNEMIQESDITFIVKRPINKNPRFEIIQNKIFKDQDFLFGECLDIYLNKKDKLGIADLRDIETARIENGISNYERCLYFVKNNASPSLFDIRSYIDRSKKTCPFCGKKLSSSNQVFYEENSTCSLLIHHTEKPSSKSFVICNDCNNKYKTGGQLVPMKGNFITSSSISTFIGKNHKFLINVNEFIDLPIIEIPYQTDPQTLISQNASVYGYSFEKCSRNDIRNLLSVNSSSSVKFDKEAFVLLFFQTNVNIKKILYTKSSDAKVTLKITTPSAGVVINTEENPISFERRIECKSVQLTFIPNGEVSLEKIQIFGDFLLPIDDGRYKISREVIQYSQNRVLIECKPKFDDKFNTVQNVPHTGVVKGYRIQIKKGFKICSLIFAFFKKNVYITHHCVLLPDKLCAKNNDNKNFYIPYEFTDDHDSIKIFYLDRQPGNSVNIKIDTVK